MSELTKKAIQQSLMEQLESKPLSEITVVGLCKSCGINHNTFYYHYPDIYAVIQEYFDNCLKDVIAVYDETLSWERAFDKAIEPVLQHKKAVYHIYDSVRKELLIYYFYQSSLNVMDKFAHSILPEVKATEKDRSLIARFFASALTALVLSWVKEGMKENPYQLVERFGFLFNGSIEEALRRSAGVKDNRIEDKNKN